MKSRAASSVVMFDVVYVDGTRRSNRKVPASLLDGLDLDAPAQAFIEAQDRDIAAASGRPCSDVKSIVRSPIKLANDDAGSARKLQAAKRKGG